MYSLRRYIRILKRKRYREDYHGSCARMDTLGERAVDNGMKINPGKSKAIRFTRAPVKNPLGYSLRDQNLRKRAVVNNWE